MNRIIRTKNWLATVSSTSWHYRLVNYAGVRVSQKACVYYWVCIPKALLNSLAIGFLYCLIVGGGYLVGFTADENADKEHLFLPYKMRRDGRKKFVTPAEIGGVVLLVYFIWSGARWSLTPGNSKVAWDTAKWFAFWIVVAGGILAAVALLGLLYRRFQKSGRWHFRFSTKGLWDKICPNLKVVKTHEGV